MGWREELVVGGRRRAEKNGRGYGGSSSCWCGRGPLPACRQVKPVDLWGQIGQEQLQLGEEGKVVGGDVWMWAAADIVLYKPVGVQGAQDTQHVQVRLRVENVVDDTLKRDRKGY